MRALPAALGRSRTLQCARSLPWPAPWPSNAPADGQAGALTPDARVAGGARLLTHTAVRSLPPLAGALASNAPADGQYPWPARVGLCSCPRASRPSSIARLQAYASLGELGESIEDEWSYVNDLTQSGSNDCPRWPPTALRRPPRRPWPSRWTRHPRDRLIEDPHRAIDWLVDLPAGRLAALGEAP
jgi:hypothetical protein